MSDIIKNYYLCLPLLHIWVGTICTDSLTMCACVVYFYFCPTLMYVPKIQGHKETIILHVSVSTLYSGSNLTWGMWLLWRCSTASLYLTSGTTLGQPYMTRRGLVAECTSASRFWWHKPPVGLRLLGCISPRWCWKYEFPSDLAGTYPKKIISHPRPWSRWWWITDDAATMLPS